MDGEFWCLWKTKSFIYWHFVGKLYLDALVLNTSKTDPLYFLPRQRYIFLPNEEESKNPPQILCKGELRSSLFLTWLGWIACTSPTLDLRCWKSYFVIIRLVSDITELNPFNYSICLVTGILYHIGSLLICNIYIYIYLMALSFWVSQTIRRLQNSYISNVALWNIYNSRLHKHFTKSDQLNVEFMVALHKHLPNIQERV